MEVEMSTLPKTWVLDLDGTIVKHNGYKIDGEDSLLPGAADLLAQIKEDDYVLFITSRERCYQKITEDFLKKHHIRFDAILYEAPYGERILINDKKSSGLVTAYAFNPERDVVSDITIRENPEL